MAKFKNTKVFLEQKFITLALTGIWAEMLGMVKPSGLWLIYGEEKMGKTTFALLLSEELRKIKRVGYVMGEQGLDLDFQQTFKRLNIKVDPRLKVSGYIPINELNYLIKKKNQPEVIILDNLTSYYDELKGGELMKFVNDNPNKLIIALAHYENGALVGSVARTAKRFANRIIKVDGNAAYVDGRVKGGSFIIDEEKAVLYHGGTV